jgi:FkbM family methyltransferase
MKYLFDVGAHWGQDSLEQVRNNPEFTCFAFEPTPELVNRLRNESSEFSERYKVYQQAISDFDGEAVFNLVVGDTGSSSLNEFSDDIATTWQGRTDFVVRDKIKVDVYRLDTWLNSFAPEVTEIEHLHIDAQGSDLAVLKGLGEKLRIVKSGVVEVPQSENVKLYKTQHTKEETIAFLVGNGFKITNVTHQHNEDNIFFERE